MALWKEQSPEQIGDIITVVRGTCPAAVAKLNSLPRLRYVVLREVPLPQALRPHVAYH